MYSWLVRIVLAGGFIAVGLHLKSKRDMRTAASKVVIDLEKEGPRAQIDEQGAVVVFMDGKVQQVLPPDKRRIDEETGKDDAVLDRSLVRKHIAR